MMCLHSAAPCYLSGPHLGTIADIQLYRMYPPPLNDIECIFGDKAYCDKKLVTKIITPIKKQKRKKLSDEAEQYNELVGWYRSSIEHTFGFMKRFRILSKCISTYFYLIMYPTSHIAFSLFFFYVLVFVLFACIDSKYRGDISYLASIIKIIAHVDAYYLSHNPHRTFDSIAEVSIPVHAPASSAVDPAAEGECSGRRR
jgi:hypothetical protein